MPTGTYSRKFNQLFKEAFAFNCPEDQKWQEEDLFDAQIRETFNWDKLLELIDSSYLNKNPIYYKTKYEDLTGLLVPTGFQVHHIDIDRENPHISNLVALPNKLHHKYHSVRSDMFLLSKPCNQDGDFIMPIGMFDTGGGETGNFQRLKTIEKFVNIQQECCYWVGYRNALLGINHGWPAYNYKKY